MRHYEIVVVIHPDQSEQVNAMVEKYRSIIETRGGVIHRFEDWGRMPLAYSVNKIHKAHYILFNIECSKEALNELQVAFRFNDAIIRHMTLHVDEAITEPSVIFQERNERKDTRPAFGKGNSRPERGSYDESTDENYDLEDESTA